jgi:hypothetical protein
VTTTTWLELLFAWSTPGSGFEPRASCEHPC